MTASKVEKLVDAFILDIATLYEPIIAASVEDVLFENMVTKVVELKKKLVVSLTEVPVEEPVVTPPKPVEDLQPQSSIPREVGSAGAVNEVFNSTDFESMATAASTSRASSGAPSSAGFVDEETNVPAHNLGLSVAEENRISAGLPAKRKAPHIQVDHTGVTETSPHPNIPRPVPGKSGVAAKVKVTEVGVTEETKNILRRLQDICMPHQTSPVKALSGMACAVLSLVSAYLPIDHPKEAPRYESVKALWGALQNIISTLKKTQGELGKYRELGGLQKDIDALITQLIVETAQYSLPDEVPVEKNEENPTQEEEKDAQ